MKKVYKYQVEQELKELKKVPLSCFDKKIETVLADKYRGIYIPKEQRYYCMKCKEWHTAKGLKRNQEYRCECGAKLQIIHRRNNIADIKEYLTYIETNERNELIIRIFHLLVTYDKEYMEYTNHIVEVERINYDHKIAMCSNTNRFMGYYYGVTHTFNEDKFRRDRSEFYKEYNTDLIGTKNIRKTFENTRYKYHRLDLIAKYNIDIIEYLQYYNPSLETMLKCGGWRFVQSYVLKSYYSRGIGCYEYQNRWSISRICKYNMNVREFGLYKKFGDDADIEVIRSMALYSYDSTGYVRVSGELEWKQHARTFEYIKENKIEQSDYFDYLGWLKRLGVKLDNKNKYPKDFKIAHDSTFKQFEDSKNLLIDKGIRERSMTLNPLEFSNKNYLIRAVGTQTELIEESEKLHHCVRTYAEKVADGSTSIFVIREWKEPTEPFVTLELKNKRVIQCRSKYNGVPSEEVQNFVNEWAKKYEFETCFR